jgi:uridine kinase
MQEQVIARTSMLDRLADLIAAVERPHPVRVGIEGRSAAGKTTLADELAPLIEQRARPVIRASIDDFHRPADQRYVRGRLSPDGYYLDAFNYPAVRASLLLPLGPGGGRRYRTAIFDAFHDRPIEQPERVAPDNAIVVVDGIFLARPELRDLWEFRIFVEIDAEESIRRGCLRDQTWMGSAEAARERYLTRYVPAENRYLQEIQPRRHADVVVDNRDPARPALTLHPSIR